MATRITDKIRKHLPFLFDIYGFSVTSETTFESFGNWVVVLESKECRLRFFQDRGEITLAVGPLWSPPGWQSGPWFDFRAVIRYLSHGNDRWEYGGGSTEEQLRRLAEKLPPHLPQIFQLFREDVFPKKQPELQRTQSELDDEFWKSLGL